MSKKRKVPEHIRIKRKIAEVIKDLELGDTVYYGGVDKLMRKQLKLELKELRNLHPEFFL